MQTSSTHLLGDVAGLSHSVLALGGELGQCGKLDAADDSDEGDDGERDERQLPRRREAYDEAGHEGCHVVDEVAQLQKGSDRPKLRFQQIQARNRKLRHWKGAGTPSR